MKLTSLLHKSHCLARTKSRKLESILKRILEHLSKDNGLKTANGKEVDIARLTQEFMDRERKGPTALGCGVGYPHIRQAGFSEFALALATSPEGLDCETPDGEPVRLILVAIAPPEKNALLLGIVACLGRMMADQALIRGLIEAQTDDELWHRLDEADLDVTENIKAGDVMKREFRSIPADMTIADVAALMHREREDVLPVVDDAQKLLGEVSVTGLLASCLPPYFSQMPSMSFARDFDPFARFFLEKAQDKVADVLQTDVPVLSPDAPMTEVVAHMARKEVGRLYVTEEGRLVGVIDNFAIIDKFLSI